MNFLATRIEWSFDTLTKEERERRDRRQAQKIVNLRRYRRRYARHAPKQRAHKKGEQRSEILWPPFSLTSLAKAAWGHDAPQPQRIIGSIPIEQEKTTEG